MWIDENGVAHTAWVPPETILGEEAVAMLRAVPRAAADQAIRELDAVAESIEDVARAAAAPGPSHPERTDLDNLPYPPVFPGLATKDDEKLSTALLRYLSGVPTEWRYDALEAMYDVLEPPPMDEN
ncbi:hypothetical protein [Microlunatus sp. GCM10028923]|uniref:hypothetical protein n=1 Tax=Microlunatus sp. GCM10028923 TaxID=3273400 RepID=UPI00361AE1F4